jgi:hypothetical protein
MNRITRVLVPAPSLDLVDLQTVKLELGIAPDDPAQDMIIERYIAASSAKAHSYCSRIFPVQTYQDTFTRQPPGWYNGHHPEILALAQRPVIEVLSVAMDGGALAVDGYQIDYDAGWLRAVSSSGVGYWTGAQVVVEYMAGFADIPDDVEAAVLELVTTRVSAQGRDPMLRSRDGPTYGREEFWLGGGPGQQSGMPERVAQDLEHYRIRALA